MHSTADLIYVEWRDAASNTAWHDLHSMQKQTLELCESVGWVDELNKDFIRVYACYGQSQNFENTEYGRIMVIPRKCITKLTYLRRAKKKKR